MIGLITVLLITGSSDLPYHDWKQTAPFLKETLERTGRFKVTLRDSGPGDLSGFDVILVDYNGPRWGEEAESAIEKFVSSGKGIATFHLTSYAFEGWKAWPEINGAVWFKLGHSKRRVFKVDIIDKAHPITQGVPSPFDIDDELYNGLTLNPGIVPLADAWDDPAASGTGKRHPLVWCGSFGQGRLFHMTLGHDLKGLSAEGFQKLLVNGVAWAATSP